MYPLYATSRAEEPQRAEFVNMPSVRFNTVSANTFHFYEGLKEVAEAELANFVEPDSRYSWPRLRPEDATARASTTI
ncbi:hypothetical protein SAZ10_29980 [Mesorhizobium sp. BAC0120]|uniref:hypothetical protein n=1 Tax=Mesorhizobium sp. BAC0120 TaxID=3090670 RepID=UPI00298D3EF8|nr:hypothetical protein [Mesorhizobium sp. BAC0120]MDW6025995.1 hypothetical protein [Mesorhizobium sp. BAC0120]